MNRINYHKMSLTTISNIDRSKSKPTLCMHVCCGPCSTFPLSWLTKHFNLTIYFNNSNIYPSTEYNRRLKELKNYLSAAKLPVTIIVTPYQNESFTAKLAPFKDEPECGKRCLLCYRMRMNDAYNYAHTNNFDFFTTVMTISRQKSSTVLNEIGEQLSHKYPNTQYFYSDFKKDDGNLKGLIIADEFNLYRQNYCGCIYSYQNKFDNKL